MSEPVTSFLHQGSLGDTVASLPAIREYYKKYGKKAILYLQDGVKAVYYQNAVHPTMGDDGITNVMLNKDGINMMAPLFKEQEYIADCKIWNNEPIHINLGMIRETNVGMPNLCLSRWYFQCLPDLACDLSETWLNVPNTEKDFAKEKIIVTRTERYLNPNINYKFLKKYEDLVKHELAKLTPLERKAVLKASKKTTDGLTFEDCEVVLPADVVPAQEAQLLKD